MEEKTAAELVKTDHEMLKYLKRISDSNKFSRVMTRGILTGIFSALGTTIGFALLLIIIAQSVTGLRQIPFIDQFLEQTKLDLLIESQLARVNREVVTGEDPAETPDTTEDPVVELNYSDTELGFGFNYPSTLNSFKEIEDEDGSAKQVRFSGTGSLQALDIYVNQDVVVFGSDSSQKFVARDDIDRITVNIFENGATVGDLAVNNPLYFTEFTAGSNEYHIIGIADSELPKLGREVFISIIESMVFDL